MRAIPPPPPFHHFLPLPPRSLFFLSIWIGFSLIDKWLYYAQLNQFISGNGSFLPISIETEGVRKEDTTGTVWMWEMVGRDGRSVCVCRWRIENINTEKNKDSLFLTVFSLFSFFSWISVGFSSILYQGPPHTMISFRGTILFKSKGYIFVSNTNLFIVCVENGENDFKANIFWLLFVLKPNVWLIKILSGKIYCFKLTVYIF